MIPKIKYITIRDDEFLYTETYQNDKDIKNNFVILHGLGDSNSTLLLVENILKDIPHSKCIIYDLRGHGLSSKKIPPYTKDIESIGAQDLSFVCNYFNVKNPTFICHSIGGIFVQTYLEQKLSPSPKEVLLLCTPLQMAPFSISRKFWFNIYKTISPLLRTSNNKRSLNQHIGYRDTIDVSPSRILSDIYYMGIINFILIYFSLFGWENSNLSSINKKNIHFCCGINDVLLPEKKQLGLLKNIDQININKFDSNHHQIYINNYKKITSLLKDITEKK